jgi:cytochrome b6-f complex iron-sulfur subunit
MVSEDRPEERRASGEQPATPPAEPAAAAPTPPAAAAPVGGEAAPPRARKDMSPEERAAAIKAAQERALRMKAERDAAKAAAAGTAVATTEAPGAAAAPTGPTWRIPAATAGQVAVARPDAGTLAEVARTDRQVQIMIKRRQALRGGVFASLGGFIILMLGSFLNFFNPRHITGFGGTVKIPASSVPKPGDDPKKFFDMKGYIVNLKPGEGGHGAISGSEKGGLIALYQKCVHLGCTVPWRPEFDFDGVKGWFRCPCHGSTYTKGGARVFGPAPRSLDTFDLTINGDGSLTVNTGKITLGDTSDPQRGKLPPA